MRTSRLVLLAVFSILGGVAAPLSGAHADLLLGAPANTSQCVPFGCGGTFQQAFSAALFQAPTTINAVFFSTSAVESFVLPGTITIGFSLSALPVGSLSSDPAANIGKNAQIFATLTLPTGAYAYPAFGFEDYTTPYVYDPHSGDLLMTVTVIPNGYPLNPPDPVFVDANDAFVGAESVVNGQIMPNYGLVTDFVTAMPEPSSFVLFVTGLAVFAASACHACQHRPVH